MGWKLVQQFYQRHDLYSRVPRHEQSVYVYLLFTAHPDGTAVYPSLETIANITNHQARQARNIVTHLEEEGFLVRISVGRGRGNSPLWHIPLGNGPTGQHDWIVPQRPEMPAATVSQAGPATDRRGHKQRPVRLVKADDTDQASAVNDYHQAVVEYQAGYPAQRQLSVVRVTEATSEAEMEEALINEFHATLTQLLEVAAAKVVHRQQKLDEAVGAAGRRIMQRLLDQAKAEYDELLAEQQRQQQIQQTQRREVL